VTGSALRPRSVEDSRHAIDELLRPNGRLYMDFVAGRRKFAVSSFTYWYVFPGGASRASAGVGARG